MPVLDVPVVEEKGTQSVTEQLCKHQEEPQVYAEKPACEAMEAPCAEADIPQEAEPQEEEPAADETVEEEPTDQLEETFDTEAEGVAEEVEA